MDIEKSRVYDKRRLLKIKLKSLHEEVKIIRAEEAKLLPAARKGSEGATAMIKEMADHRHYALREETRATLLAYGYIRGRKYREIEPKSTWTQSNAVRMYDSWQWPKRLARITKMVEKYGIYDNRPAFIQETAEKIQAWMNEGVAELDHPPTLPIFPKTPNGGRT